MSADVKAPPDVTRPLISYDIFVLVPDVIGELAFNILTLVDIHIPQPYL